MPLDKTKGEASEDTGGEGLCGLIPPQFKKVCMSNYSSNLSFLKCLPFRNAFLIQRRPIKDEHFILIVFFKKTISLGKDDIAEIFWIGLNQLDVSGGWQWSDHKPLNFLNWHPGTNISGDMEQYSQKLLVLLFFRLIPFSEASFPPSQ